MLRVFFLVFTLLLLTESVLAEQIKIGTLLDLSKEYVMESNAFREGAELAVRKINANGGVRGKKLKLVIEDTQYNMKNVATASKKLINIDKINAAVIGTYTEVMVAGAIFEKAQVPLVNIWDSAPEIEALGDYIFGIGIWTPGSSDLGSEFALNTLKAKTAVTVCHNGEWSLSVAGDFKRKFEAAGGKVLKGFEVNPSDSDFRTVLQVVKSLKPDLLYAPVTDNISAFWLQAARLGLDMQMMTSDIISEEIIKQTGKATEGVYQTQSADPDNPEVREMIKAYKNQFSKDCTQVFLTSLGYDSILFLAEAMKKKGLDGEAIKDGLYNIVDFNGASGPATMTPEGSVKRLSGVFQVRDGDFVAVP